MFVILRKHHLMSATLCIVLLVVVAIISNGIKEDSIEASNTVSENWGLSFRTEGQPPTANATSEFLKKYNSFYIDSSKNKVIYLTFDAGYEDGHTGKILDTLKKHKVPAVFFVVGNYIETAPELIKRMADDGHIVGNHTYHHYDMSKIRDIKTFKEELTALESLYKETTGKVMEKFYRPPQGKYSEENLKQANELGYKTVFWSLAYVDWYKDRQPTKNEAFNKLIPRIHPGAVVLLHSTSKTNADILDELLTEYEKMGYKFGCIRDIK